MSEMRMIAIFSPDGKNVDEKKVGFHSRQVLYYSETNDPDITAVVLSKEGLQETLFVKMRSYDFYKLKVRAESEDIFTYTDN